MNIFEAVFIFVGLVCVLIMANVVATKMSGSYGFVMIAGLVVGVVLGICMARSKVLSGRSSRTDCPLVEIEATETTVLCKCGRHYILADKGLYLMLSGRRRVFCSKIKPD